MTINLRKLTLGKRLLCEYDIEVAVHDYFWDSWDRPLVTWTEALAFIKSLTNAAEELHQSGIPVGLFHKEFPECVCSRDVEAQFPADGRHINNQALLSLSYFLEARFDKFMMRRTGSKDWGRYSGELPQVCPPGGRKPRPLLLLVLLSGGFHLRRNLWPGSQYNRKADSIGYIAFHISSINRRLADLPDGSGDVNIVFVNFGSDRQFLEDFEFLLSDVERKVRGDGPCKIYKASNFAGMSTDEEVMTALTGDVF
ncbi:MAG: hypothetical protein HY986_02400 [Candidatus Melainabacteria bacterium]|nr:hypothetical protein [Candidatus Melainabacteria bacterium]